MPLVIRANVPFDPTCKYFHEPFVDFGYKKHIAWARNLHGDVFTICLLLNLVRLFFIPDCDRGFIRNQIGPASYPSTPYRLEGFHTKKVEIRSSAAAIAECGL